MFDTPMTEEQLVAALKAVDDSPKYDEHMKTLMRQSVRNAYKMSLGRAGWGPGPWDTEPDRLEWLDGATMLPCLIVRNDYGGLCGYVGVPPGHPAFEFGYDDVSEAGIETHGGLTYADHCPGKICHVAEPGAPEVWWLGFDCVHGGDDVPGIRMPNFGGSEYRDIGYVRSEVTQLAAQLAALQPGSVHHRNPPADPGTSSDIA